MVTDGRRVELAEFLVRVWPKLPLVDGNGGSAPMSVRLGGQEPDLYLAVSTEVSQLADHCAPLRSHLVPGANGKRPPAPDVGTLNDALEADAGHHSEILWTLLGAAGEVDQRPVEGGNPFARGYRWVRRQIRAGTLAWLPRVWASIWMNTLIAVAALIAFGWPTWVSPVEWVPASEGSGGHVVVLEVFALWALSFLPGWLYVRFLGQRAGALWTEYVVNLHRLGWNRPGYLPRPPTASRFFEEWLEDGGPLYDQSRNLYRQKFEAYYGRQVVTHMERDNFAVRVGTLFPVFLATAILAACWGAVLYDTAFLTAPESLWDMLRFAFLGAYAFVAQSLIRRFFQSDLKPSAYAAVVLRIVLVLLVMTALHQVLAGRADWTEAVVAFMVGVFPIIALQAMQRIAASALQVVVPQLTPDYPLNQLDGLNIWYESRLLEEGIEDMQNLVTANLVDVVLHTRVPVGRLVDWVDQAALYVHLDRVERGIAERHQARKTRNKELKAARQGIVVPGTDPTQTGSPAAGETPEVRSRVEGSVNRALRAGTHVRVGLRQLGIRTATDLLKAFPPPQIDRYRAAEASTTSPVFDKLLPDRLHRLDRDQLRTLVRVLDENANLAPVWNWQRRGPEARDCRRRPRSWGPCPAPDADQDGRRPGDGAQV